MTWQPALSQAMTLLVLCLTSFLLSTQCYNDKGALPSAFYLIYLLLPIHLGVYEERSERHCA